MALSRGRGGQRFSALIWPGFVDAMTTLLLILIFLVTIFMVVQFALRDAISTKDNELKDLSAQVSDLADALGLERSRSASLADNLDAAQVEADRQSTLIATLRGQVAEGQRNLDQAQAQITSFEAQVASLLSERDAAENVDQNGFHVF